MQMDAIKSMFVIRFLGLVISMQPATKGDKQQQCHYAWQWCRCTLLINDHRRAAQIHLHGRIIASGCIKKNK